MSHFSNLSGPSPSCRLEWRPSRCLATALLSLAVLASFSMLVTDMPRWLAWPLALVVLVRGTWQGWRHLHLPPQQFLFPGNDLAPMRAGQPIGDVSLQWRGPLAFLCWRERGGQLKRLAWWPDNLPAASRRELRLAVGSGNAAPRRPGMAP